MEFKQRIGRDANKGTDAQFNGQNLMFVMQYINHGKHDETRGSMTENNKQLTPDRTSIDQAKLQDGVFHDSTAQI
jgi:hypothetical protein